MHPATRALVDLVLDTGRREPLTPIVVTELIDWLEQACVMLGKSTDIQGAIEACTLIERDIATSAILKADFGSIVSGPEAFDDCSPEVAQIRLIACVLATPQAEMERNPILGNAAERLCEYLNGLGYFPDRLYFSR